jgi:FlaA1/EpsC-like NDP-sugar epimerase
MKFAKNIRNRYLLIGDLILISISILLSFQLRLEFIEVFINYYRSVLWMIGISLLIRPLVYYFFGLYRRMWVYASTQELKQITLAVTIASAVISTIMLGLFATRTFFFAFPRSVLIIDWIIEIMFAGGLRFLLRLLGENRISGQRQNNSPIGKRVLIIGAGDAGALVVKEMQRNPQLNLYPIGFLDDDRAKHQQQIHGIPVIGGLNELDKVVSHKHINEVIISIPSAPGRVVRIVTDICQKRHIPFRTMPGIYELLGGKVNISRLREVEISDLLRREPVRFNEEIVGSIITDKVVLVTGAGGSIGSELCRQIARWNPKQLILLGHGENSIFETYLELQEDYPTLKTETVIADIRDDVRIDQEIKEFHPYVIFHAAAHKHVPLMEKNIEECITNNIQGTQNVLKACLRNNVERLIFISTDKAIRPANVMGATKRIAEMLVLDAAERTGKAYSVVRFGNVLGSRGSVVPLFKHQIAHGGPVTVTHKDMQRYFMTIPEAVYLVLQAASLGKGGETFILNMGEQIKIVDLARDLIRLSGLEPEKDVEIVFTGMRKGEKLSEDLWNHGRKFAKTEHPEIFCEEGQDELQGKDLQSSVRELLRLAEEGQGRQILRRLEKIVPGIEHLGSQEHALYNFDS